MFTSILIFYIYVVCFSRIYHDVFNIETKEPVDIAAKTLEDKSGSPPPGLDRFTTNEQQEQNVYAQNAVKRVRSRLEGNIDDNSILTVEEQVHFIGYTHILLY